MALLGAARRVRTGRVGDRGRATRSRPRRGRRRMSSLDPGDAAARADWARGAIGLDLMRAAGRGVRRVRWPSRRLREGQQRRRRARRRPAAAPAGSRVCVLLLAPGEQLSGDARTNFERVESLRDSIGVRCANPPTKPVLPTEMLRRAWRLDRRRDSRNRLRGGAARRRGGGDRSDQRSARGDAIVIACDVPSGVDASTGEIAGGAVHADATAHLPRRQARPLDRARERRMPAMCG